VDYVSRASDDAGPQAQELRVSADLENHLGTVCSLTAGGAAVGEWKDFWSQHEVPFVANRKQRFSIGFLIHMKIAIRQYLRPHQAGFGGG
jgi:hypothetical protein